MTFRNLRQGRRYSFRASARFTRWGPYSRATAWVRPGPPTPTPTPTDPPVGAVQLHVDPSAGSDGNTGTSANPLATITEAWRRIPSGTELATPYWMQLHPGAYPAEASPNYWESRWGTAAAPIVISAVAGAHTAVMNGDMNMFDVRHLRVVGVDIIRSGDAFHCELCSHVRLENMELSGGGAAHETIKVNQSDHFDVINSDVHGAYENAIDFVAVQHSLIRGNRIHDGDDWCAYVKGGSASVEVDNNEIYDCGTGGFTAGQGTGFEFMTAPWLRYEAYGVTVTDNVIHDTDGAGLGVNGGYNIVMAFNTLYRVGSRSHTVEFVHGARSCDGDVPACRARRALGGWGTADAGGQWIPNKHVYFLNNVVLNPSGYASAWQHFTVADPVTPPPESGVPSPSRADDDLRIRGNVIWNGGPDMPTGVADPAALGAANRINTLQPQLRDPAAGDFRPLPGGNLAALSAAPIPAVAWADSGGVPDGGNPTIDTDRPPGALRP